MAEREAMNIATLHLDGEENDSWFHGMKTLGNYQVTTYDEFTRRMIDKFEIRDPKTSFRELAHVKQTRTHEAYISE